MRTVPDILCSSIWKNICQALGRLTPCNPLFVLLIQTNGILCETEYLAVETVISLRRFATLPTCMEMEIQLSLARYTMERILD